MRGVRVTLLVLIVLLVPASSAMAGTANAGFGQVSFTASPGETNNVSVTGGGASVTIQDTGAGITAGNSCSQNSPNQVTCTPAAPAGSPTVVSADLGDLNDAFVGNAQAIFIVVGGAGNDSVTGADVAGTTGDQLSGGDGDDLLDARGGQDILDGGPGTDTLRGGDGDDTLLPANGTHEPDTVDGGLGVDNVNYTTDSVPVTVNISSGAGAVSGAAGEGDTLINIENVMTGSADDTIFGSTADNQIFSNGGADNVKAGPGNDSIFANGAPGAVLDGEGGNDTISTGQGGSQLLGGAGDDTLLALNSAGGERLDCGADVDQAVADATDTVDSSCETVNGKTVALPAPVAGKSVNAVPVSGVVLIKVTVPGKRAAHGAATAFVPLTAGQQIRVGSELDVTRGVVRLTAAADLKKGGKLASGEFSKGRFKVRQQRASKTITELQLTGTLSKCAKRKAGAAGLTGAATRRRLVGNARGRYRTRGRYSTATVRGTKWITEDTCAGTLTSVQSGVVQVRDLVKRKNVTLKKGRRYLARPR